MAFYKLLSILKNTDMTIKELRKAMRGLDENMEIYISNHDHNEWETDGRTCDAVVNNQTNYREELEHESDNCQPEIDGDYLVIRT